MRLPANYKTILLWAAPVALCAAAGSYYYFRVNSSSNDKPKLDDSKPRTPLEKAIQMKDKGNKYFKGSKFKEAIECYTEAIETCPENANSELATFYQNRAAAKENLAQIDSSIEDCTHALKYSPRYLKALNRRARLYERVSKLYLSLLDATALTIFESFGNVENVMFMERLLTQIAAKETESIKNNLKHQLPASSFIRNYFSAFNWDPILCEENELIISSSIYTEANSLSKGDGAKLPFEELKHAKDSVLEQNTLSEFLNLLCEAILSARKGTYEASFEIISEALELCHEPESLLKFQTPQVPNGLIKIFIALASLLKGTYLALSGQISEAHSLLDSAIKTHQDNASNAIESIINGIPGEAGDAKVNWTKYPSLVLIKVNALIKKACLIMTSEHDLASCLSAFQQAEQLCPQCPDLFLHRGQIFIITDQIDEALNDFNTSIKLNPTRSMARCQRTFASYRKAVMENDPERALSRIEEFAKLVNKYPNCLETRSLYAQILSERCEFQKADNQFEEVLKLSPDSGMIYGHRAMMYLRLKQDREEAMKILNDGLKMDSKCGMLHELAAQIALEAGDFATALEHLDAALKLTTTEPEMKHLLALYNGAKAQKEVCEIYGITREEIKAWHLALQQKMMASMQMSA